MGDSRRQHGPGTRGVPTFETRSGGWWAAVCLLALPGLAPADAAGLRGQQPVEVGLQLDSVPGRPAGAVGPTLLVLMPGARVAQQELLEPLRACRREAGEAALVVVIHPPELAPATAPRGLAAAAHHVVVDVQGAARARLVADAREAGPAYVLLDGSDRVLTHGRFDAGVRHELRDAIDGHLDLRRAVEHAGLFDPRRGAQVDRGRAAGGGETHWRPWALRLQGLPEFDGLGGRAVQREFDAACRALDGRPVFVAQVLLVLAERFPGELRRAEVLRQLRTVVRAERRDAVVQRAGFACFGELGQDRNARACGFSWLQSCKGLPGRAAEVIRAVDGLHDGPARFRVLVEQAIDIGLGAEPDDRQLRLRGFQHAFRFERGEAAVQVAGANYIERLRGDAQQLNALAWRLLTDAPYAGHCDALALRAARAMAEVDGWRSYWRLDTLALACFENGLVEEAVELQAEAVEGADAASRTRYAERLEHYRAARGR